ncbi:MAG: ParB/RepB/Spo0J family partition protein [Acidobacteria bacterium]|nr:MAG: ParB/RepB/Spo0J family partition protein [Acidobacteriota bacterium]
MSKRKALGKGLSSLIPETPRAGATGVLSLDLGLIHPSPDQPRKQFDEAALEELASSIRSHGVLQPVIVTRDGNGYRLVIGERRWRAASLAGIAKIPAIVREVGERDRLEMALIENLQRRDLNPVEEARAYRLLLDEFDLGHEELAGRVGKSRPHVSNLLRILNLDGSVLDAVASCQLSMGHARALAGVTSRDDQKRLAAQVVDRGLSVRALEALIGAADGQAGRGERAAGTRKRRDPNIVAAEEKLKAALGAQVRITGGQGRGKIVIDYVNPRELQRLFDLLEKSARQAPPPPARDIRLPGHSSRRVGQGHV